MNNNNKNIILNMTTYSNDVQLLCSGFLEKKNPITGIFYPRMVVLSTEALSWCKHQQGDDLFGERTGSAQLKDIDSVKILEENSLIFEIWESNGRERQFRASHERICAEWVSEIKSAIDQVSFQDGITSQKEHVLHVSGVKFIDAAGTEASSDPITVTSITIHSEQHSEVVIATQPQWEHIILLPSLLPYSEIRIYLSNNKLVRIPYGTVSAVWKTGEAHSSWDSSLPDETHSVVVNITMMLDQTKLLNGSRSNSSTTSSGSSVYSMLEETVLILLFDRNFGMTLLLLFCIVLYIAYIYTMFSVEMLCALIWALMLVYIQYISALTRLHAASPLPLPSTTTSVVSAVEVADSIAGLSVLLHSCEACTQLVHGDDLPQRFLDG